MASRQIKLWIKLFQKQPEREREGERETKFCSTCDGLLPSWGCYSTTVTVKLDGPGIWPIVEAGLS